VADISIVSVLLAHITQKFLKVEKVDT